MHRKVASQKNQGTSRQPSSQKSNNQPKVSRRRKTRAGSTINDDDGGATVVTINEDEENVNRPRKASEISLENFGMSVARKKIEGLKAEFKMIQEFKPADTTATAFEANKGRNRYMNISCYDRTRVALTYHVPPDTDYIHANWTKPSFVELGQRYICTQGPTDATVPDFWRMIWQEKARFIVMLCSVIENGKPKCAQYYPLQNEESKTFGTITVTNKRNLTAGNEKIFETTLFEVFSATDIQEASIQVTLIHWNYWPDFSVPMSGMGMLRILKTIRDVPNATAVIHCSAGIGRTGTLMACEICLRIMLDGKELNVMDVVKELRSQRAGAIQTESQYIYLHRALCEYIHAKKMLREDMSKFFIAYADYLKTLVKPNANPTVETPAPSANPPSPALKAPAKPNANLPTVEAQAPNVAGFPSPALKTPARPTPSPAIVPQQAPQQATPPVLFPPQIAPQIVQPQQMVPQQAPQPTVMHAVQPQQMVPQQAPPTVILPPAPGLQKRT